MQQHHATPTAATTDQQLRISTDASGVHKAAIIGTGTGGVSFKPLALIYNALALKKLVLYMCM